MATATDRRQEKAGEAPHGSASKPKSAGGTNTPKTKGSRSGGGPRPNTKGGNGTSGSGSNGNGRANGNGNSGSATKGATKGKGGSSAKGGTSGKSKGRSNGSGPSGKGKGVVKQAAKSTAKKAAKSTMNSAIDVAEEGTGLSKPKKFAAKLALKAIKRSAGKMADGSLASALEMLRLAAQKAAEKGHDTFSNTGHQRLPIQRSVDVAVPLKIAWEEWLELDSLPEGVDTVSEIDRDGDTLTGRIDGPHSRDWEAEILDEREEQSFAWQSHEGSDCAGLVTFHALSERLTRLELNLDVVPSGVGETLKLSTHLADRRAEAELRRFKARVELINPDEYEDELRGDEDDDDEDWDDPEDRTDDEDRDDPDNPDDDADEADAD